MSRRFLRSLMPGLRGKTPQERFYALKNLSVSLSEGDSLAVVGANGAGKSTLLSLIAGLSWPDEGQVAVSGLVTALLELGSGFHPELTGAENVRLNAALLGLTRREARERFDQIVDFSGIGDFIEEPLRSYSAGMIMRLAFSTAMNVEPDILLIDEVLAVGDEAFQSKCMERILELKQRGRVLVCISHDPEILKRLCNRALWLDHGSVVDQGSAGEILEAYHNSVSEVSHPAGDA